MCLSIFFFHYGLGRQSWAGKPPPDKRRHHIRRSYVSAVGCWAPTSISGLLLKPVQKSHISFCATLCEYFAWFKSVWNGKSQQNRCAEKTLVTFLDSQVNGCSSHTGVLTWIHIVKILMYLFNGLLPPFSAHTCSDVWRKAISHYGQEDHHWCSGDKRVGQGESERERQRHTERDLSDCVNKGPAKE